MIVKLGESRQDVLRSGTYDSLLINSYLVHGTGNTAIAGNDFVPSNVNIKVVLKRDNKQNIIFQDNLLVLGSYNSLKSGYHEFINGIDKVYPATGVRAVKVRAVKLDFGGHIRVAKNDELIIEVSPNQAGTFSANLDNTLSNFEFYANPSVGYEQGIPQTLSEVVQANTTKQGFNPGDNVVKLALMNFDKNDLTNEIVSNVSLQSDRLDLSLSFNQVMARHFAMYPERAASRYGTSVPIASVPTVLRGLDYLPQSFVIFDGTREGKELDQVRLDVSFNGANVAASQNYVVHTKIQTTMESLVVAAQREQKHEIEKIEKLGG